MNRPLVTPEKFAQVASMDGFAFGVKSSCDSCDFKSPPSIRRAIKTALITNEALAEREIGFDLSKKYHVDEIMWDGRNRIQLSRFGVSELNVKESITDLGVFTISPFVLEAVSVSHDVTNGDYYITVSENFVDNPASVIIRNTDADGGGAIEQEYQHNYPRRSGTNFLISIGSAHPATVNVQHCKYMCIQVVDSQVPCVDGEVYGVRAEDDQYIPLVKTIEITGGKIYFFYAWSLVDPAFSEDETIDLEGGEFYKLVPSIHLKCSKSIAALPKVMRYPQFCDENEFPVDEEDFLIVTQIDDNILDIRTKWKKWPGCLKNQPIKIWISYRTDPALLELNLENLAKGIVYLTAAELPFGNCEGCDQIPKYGFVAMAQKSYAQMKINPITGSETFVLKYGDRYGQMVYAESIAKTKTKQGLILL